MKNNMQELSMEELSEVDGGGIKEIVAATTLAAMAITGNTVSAFGLASAMAEGNAHIEAAPAQENNGGAFEGVTLDAIEAENAGSADEVVAMDAEAVITEAEDAMFGGEEAVLNEAGEAVEPETIEEVEFDLGEANGEEEGAIIDENPEDPEQTMKDLINMAVEENRASGIYTALNSTFATLAENAEALADPETGVIETEGNAIINMTYDALKANFDKEPELLMGAIGAAALRADDAGFIQALGGDKALLAMAASQSKAGKDMMTGWKLGVTGIIDYFVKAHPALNFIAPGLKEIVNRIFALESSDPYAPIHDKLDAINARLDTMEQNLKNHMDNAVLTESFGNTFDNMRDKADDLNTEIQNRLGNSRLSDAEKKKAICDLEYTYYKDLKNAMTEASKCLKSGSFRSLSGKSLFDVAFDSCCERSMFTGEALDMATPYMLRVLVAYLKAYAAMNQWLNIYEEVYGVDSQSATRAEMYMNLGGVDVRNYTEADEQKLIDDINKSSCGVFALYRDFLNRNRYTYINYNKTRIPLKQDIRIELDFMNIACKKIQDSYYPDNNAELAKLPMSPDETKALAKHCAKMKMSISDYLFNYVYFEMTLNGERLPRNEDGTTGVGDLFVLPTGRQVVTDYRNGYSGNVKLFANVISVGEVGAESIEFTLENHTIVYGNRLKALVFQKA